MFSLSIAMMATCSLNAQSIPKPTHILQRTSPNYQAPLNNSLESFLYYDNNGNLLQSRINKVHYTSMWVPQEITYYTLDTEGKQTEALTYFWVISDSAYTVGKRILYGYHANGQVNHERLEYWIDTSSSWRLDEEQKWEFAANDQIHTYTRELYREDGNQWYGVQKNYVYDGQKRVANITDKDWKKGIWNDSTSTDFWYNGPDDEYDRSLLRAWKKNASDWVPTIRDTQLLSANERIVRSEKLLNGVWGPYSKTTIHYDANQLLLDHTVEYWSTFFSDWVPSVKMEQSYNNDMSLAKFKGYYWSPQLGALFNYLECVLDYGFYPLAVQAPVLQAKVSVSPNPALDFVRVAIEGEGNFNLSLMDLQGQVLERSTATAGSSNLLFGSRPSGIYFLQVEQGGTVKVLPIVKN